MAMTITDVTNSVSGPVPIGSLIKIQFKVTGSGFAGFTLPFSNESLTEKKVVFVKVERE